VAHQQQLLSPSYSPRRQSWLLLAALVLTGLSMRTAVTSVGAVLDDLQSGLHAGSGVAGVITTLPVICFAALGSATPRLSHRFGAHRLLVVAMLVMTLGLVLRAVAGSIGIFLLLSVLALAGGAISNVLLPSLVKQHFPDRIGPMTALYVTALATGATAGAGLSVPIGSAGGSWRIGLGGWGVLSAVAILPWLPTLRADRPGTDPTEPHAPLRSLLRSRTAWALTGFFAGQSIQAYIAFGWFTRYLTAHGVSHGTAGGMVALFAAIGIPVSLVAPRVATHLQRRVILGFCACNAVAYVGLALAPASGGWVWMVLVGIGGGTFPIALALIGLRARSAATTAALSAFVQAIGYVVAGLGPLLFGAFYGATGSWALPLTVLFAALLATAVTAFPSTADRYVDDELTPRSAKLSA
jgi:MFS transporter, CP family, cyanate transporter